MAAPGITETDERGHARTNALTKANITAAAATPVTDAIDGKATCIELKGCDLSARVFYFPFRFIFFSVSVTFSVEMSSEGLGYIFYSVEH